MLNIAHDDIIAQIATLNELTGGKVDMKMDEVLTYLGIFTVIVLFGLSFYDFDLFLDVAVKAILAAIIIGIFIKVGKSFSY